MAIYLYYLSLSLKPCEPVDNSDSRYLNQSYFPVANSVIKLLNIDLYNKTWFDKTPQLLFDHNHSNLDVPALSLTSSTSLSNFNVKTKTILPPLLIEKIDANIISLPSQVVLSKSLSISNGFF